MGLISTGPGSPLAFSSASGGKVYAYNNVSENVSIQVAPGNPSRQKILFHNPGATDLFIYPQYVLINGTNAGLAPSNGAVGGCFRVYGNGGTLVIEGECQGVWNAFSFIGGGDTNPLTVMDSNV